MRIIIFFLIATMLGCQPIHNFVPATNVTYEPCPDDHPIDFFPEGTKPEKKYVVIGMGDVRAESWAEALKTLKPLGRKHGADAILAGSVTQIYLSLSTYQGTYIRYK